MTPSRASIVRQANRCPATSRPNPWCIADCTRSIPKRTPNCATLWIGCSSTTPRSCTSPKAHKHWASASVAVPWAFAYGDHPGTPRARVRPQLDRNGSERCLPYPEDRRNGAFTLIIRHTSRRRRTSIRCRSRTCWRDHRSRVFVGAVMELCQEKRGTFKNMEYFTPERVRIEYDLPLGGNFDGFLR